VRSRRAGSNLKVADSSVFDWLCTRLEESSALNRLETRGTIRLVLREAGLEAKTVTSEQIAVVIEKLLPGELSARGVEDADALCVSIAGDVRQLEVGSGGSDSPEDIFRRLGG
jgi:hypothetical protein